MACPKAHQLPDKASRTPVILDLHRKGLSPVDIALHARCSVPNVYQMLKRNGKKPHTGHVGWRPDLGRHMQRLEIAAHARGIGPGELIKRLLDVIIADDMVDAILDDADTLDRDDDDGTAEGAR